MEENTKTPLDIKQTETDVLNLKLTFFRYNGEIDNLLNQRRKINKLIHEFEEKKNNTVNEIERLSILVEIQYLYDYFGKIEGFDIITEKELKIICKSNCKIDIKIDNVGIKNIVLQKIIEEIIKIKNIYKNFQLQNVNQKIQKNNDADTKTDKTKTLICDITFEDDNEICFTVSKSFH
jgi:hypothetical protein